MSSPAVQRLAQLPSRALPKIFFDLLAWIGIAAALDHLGRLGLTLPGVVMVGFLFSHDLLIYGHEAVHRLVSRNPIVNEAALWFLHAIAFTSGTAHRVFHLDHHRWTHQPRDPEAWVVLRIFRGRGLGYLLLPFVAPIPVNSWPWIDPRHRRQRARVLIDLAGAALLHAGIGALIGPERWLTWVVAPQATGLYLAFVLRSICEHHGARSRDRWHSARSMQSHPLLSFFWSNIEHHVEHHLEPRVATRHMPALRAILQDELDQHAVPTPRGFLSTALPLFTNNDHFDQRR